MARSNNIDPDLPDDLQDEIEGAQEATQEQIGRLTSVLVTKRAECVTARKASGIEDVWLACEEAYLGIDDANRADFSGAKWAKPTTMSGPVTTGSGKPDPTRSTVFVRLTSRYVDAGSARLSEILLPIDDKAFALTATPVPDLVKGRDDTRAVNGPDGSAMYRDQTPDEIAQEAMRAQAAQPAPGQPPASPTPTPAPGAPSPAPATTSAAPAGKTPMTVADYAKAQMEAAEDAADKAETRIYDWMVECNYPRETRKIIFDSGRIGVGVLKGPVPDIKRSQALTKDDKGGNVAALEIVEKVVPVTRWVDPWNVFPDGGCGEDIHDGDQIWERDYLSSKSLKALRGQKGYIKDQIDKVLEQGPGKCNEEGGNPSEKTSDNKSRFEVWYWYGQLSKDDMEALNSSAAGTVPDDQDDVFAIVTMVNDTVIRATLNPMDSGRFPYNAFPWSRRPGSWAGVGIAEQVDMPQRAVNAGTRSLFNNAGISSGAQVIIDRLTIAPADGKWVLTPNKIWYNLDGAAIEDVRKVFAMVEFPNVGEALMNIVNYAFKLAEEQSNIPLIAQGQGPKLAMTFGEAELLDTNANTMLRDKGYGYDNHITEPLVHAYYEWLLLDPEVPDDEKGDFNINAHGSSSLVERSIQEQTMATIGQMSLQPAYKIDPAKWVVEWLRAKRLDPRKFQYTEAEIEKMEAAPPQAPLPLQIAQLKAQSDQTIAAGRTQGAMQLQQQQSQAQLAEIAAQAQQEQTSLQNGQSTPHMAAATARIETAKIQATSQQSIEQSRAQSELQYAQTEAQMARDNAAAKMQELQMQRELAMLQYASMQKISLDTLKVQLAKTSMMENTKQQLAAADTQAQASEGALDRGHDMVKHVTNLAADAQGGEAPAQ